MPKDEGCPLGVAWCHATGAMSVEEVQLGVRDKDKDKETGAEHRVGRRIGQGTTLASKASSGYRGVSTVAGSNPSGSCPWQARITYASKKHYLGIFESPEDAARAYNAAAVHIRGADCYLNSVVPVLPADGGKAITACLPDPPGGSKWTREVAAQLQARAAANASAGGPECTPMVAVAAAGSPVHGQKRQRSESSSSRRSKRPAC